MTCLALEFSSDRRSVAIASENGLLSEVVHQGTVQTPVFALIHSALAQADLVRSQIQRLAVGSGPGSYTGIRLAISAVQGWQLATGIPTVGVNSFEGLAVEAAAFSGPVLLAVDAQRGEFAVAVAERGLLIEPIHLLSLEAVQQRIAAGWRVAGPGIPHHLPGAQELFPRAATLARMALSLGEVPAESLAPVYLREASFVKAAPVQEILPV